MTGRKKMAKSEAGAVEATVPNQTERVTAIKGFHLDWTCQPDNNTPPFRFEMGKTYKHDGSVVICQSGFHGIEGHPLEVFAYYPPGLSRYAEVEQWGNLARHTDDSKVASAEITIKAELHIPEIVARAIQWVFNRAKPEGNPATGWQGAASANGKYCGAYATGFDGRVSGVEGSALHLDERIWNTDGDDYGKIIAVWAGIIGQDGIKPGVWYLLKDGKPAEVE